MANNSPHALAPRRHNLTKPIRPVRKPPTRNPNRNRSRQRPQQRQRHIRDQTEHSKRRPENLLLHHSILSLRFPHVSRSARRISIGKWRIIPRGTSLQSKHD
jgi:hypothetical protein